jgi:hypothetical protein
MEKTDKNIIITTEVRQGEIINNFAAIKAQVEAKIAPFMGLVFQDENIKDAKATLADLRKMRTVIEEKRKAVKKQWLEPYETFEKEVRQITEIIDRPIVEIDAQIKDYEERRKQAAREECEALIDTIIDEIESDDDRDFVKACSIVFDERWLNATTAISQVEKDVRAQIDKILADAKTIMEVCEGDEILTDLLIDYQNTRDLAAVLMKRKRIIEQREAAARLADARRAQQEALESKQAEKVQINQVPEQNAPGQAQIRSDRTCIAFAVAGTVEALKALVTELNGKKELAVRRLYKKTYNGKVHWEEEN